MKKANIIAVASVLLALSGSIFAQTITTTVSASDIASCKFSDANKITGYIIATDDGNRFPSTGQAAPLGTPINLYLSTKYDRIEAVYFDGGYEDMGSAQNCDGLTATSTHVQLTFAPDPYFQGICDVTCHYQ